MNEENQNQKQGPGRPKGKKVNWSEFEANPALWKVKSNREIGESLGTSPINVFLKRRLLAKKGQDVAFEGNPETGTKPKTRKVAVTE